MFLLKLFSFSILPVGLFAAPIHLSNITDFFPNANGRLTEITWAHAVNNFTYLMRTLNDSSIMMIEADIVYGQVNGTGPNIPIMGHPPANTSDLSLKNFLEITYNFNKDPQNKLNRKGVKLDFKTTEVFESSLDVIKSLYDKIDYPLWFNADIVSGPGNATTIPVDADCFLTKSKKFTNSTLSLGWTTQYGLPWNINRAHYTSDQTYNMLDALNRNQITQPVTFAVRAGIASQSYTQMILLKEYVPNCTLTVWSSNGDYVDVKELRKVILEYGQNRVFIDVPKQLRDQLDLANTGNFIQTSIIIPMIIIRFVVYIIW